MLMLTSDVELGLNSLFCFALSCMDGFTRWFSEWPEEENNYVIKRPSVAKQGCCTV